LEFVLNNDKIFYVLSDEHQKEVKQLKMMVRNRYNGFIFLSPAIVSRLSWLEHLANDKVNSILRLCKNGT